VIQARRILDRLHQEERAAAGIAPSAVAPSAVAPSVAAE
jgi:hypothetical protein